MALSGPAPRPRGTRVSPCPRAQNPRGPASYRVGAILVPASHRPFSPRLQAPESGPSLRAIPSCDTSSLHPTSLEIPRSSRKHSRVLKRMFVIFFLRIFNCLIIRTSVNTAAHQIIVSRSERPPQCLAKALENVSIKPPWASSLGAFMTASRVCGDWHLGAHTPYSSSEVSSMARPPAGSLRHWEASKGGHQTKVHHPPAVSEFHTRCKGEMAPQDPRTTLLPDLNVLRSTFPHLAQRPRL